MRFKLIGLICLIMQCNLSCTQHIINKETVQTLDLHRYMGKWFEIARFDHRFEHNLVGSNTSDYLWLLSRTPTLPEEAILFLLTKAKERGYNTSMLKWVKQKHENQK